MLSCGLGQVAASVQTVCTIDHTAISCATRGLVTCLNGLSLDAHACSSDVFFRSKLIFVARYAAMTCCALCRRLDDEGIAG